MKALGLITKENCVRKMQDAMQEDTNKSQAAAWIVVLAYCKQHGMRDTEPTTIENVINFISKKQS